MIFVPPPGSLIDITEGHHFARYKAAEDATRKSHDDLQRRTLKRQSQSRRSACAKQYYKANSVSTLDDVTQAAVKVNHHRGKKVPHLHVVLDVISNLLACKWVDASPMVLWGYIEAIREIEEQVGASEVEFDDIVVACGSEGTIAGLALGSWLSTLKAKAKGLGYAMNTSEEIRVLTQKGHPVPFKSLYRLRVPFMSRKIVTTPITRKDPNILVSEPVVMGKSVQQP
ncbi:hypothetical protein ACFE04_008894 [Oxalis oulophora]